MDLSLCTRILGQEEGAFGRGEMVLRLTDSNAIAKGSHSNAIAFVDPLQSKPDAAFFLRRWTFLVRLCFLRADQTELSCLCTTSLIQMENGVTLLLLSTEEWSD